MGAALMSAPRSKRWEASVWRPWRREERRTAAAIEPGGFDEDVFCFGGDHGVPAAHDSGEGEGFFVVGHDEVVGFEGAFGAVEEFELFAFVGEADDDAAFELVEVEGVGGMAHAQEDEVAGVDGVGDLFLVEEGEVFGDLARGWGDGDVAEDLGGEAAAEVFCFDGDGEGCASTLVPPRTKYGDSSLRSE